MLLHCNPRHHFLYHNSRWPSFSFYRVGKDQRGNSSSICVSGSSVSFSTSYHIEMQVFPRYTWPFFGFFRIDTLQSYLSAHKLGIYPCGRSQDKDVCSKVLFFYCKSSHKNEEAGLYQSQGSDVCHRSNNIWA